MGFDLAASPALGRRTAAVNRDAGVGPRCLGIDQSLDHFEIGKMQPPCCFHTIEPDPNACRTCPQATGANNRAEDRSCANPGLTKLAEANAIAGLKLVQLSWFRLKRHVSPRCTAAAHYVPQSRARLQCGL